MLGFRETIGRRIQSVLPFRSGTLASCFCASPVCYVASRQDATSQKYTFLYGNFSNAVILNGIEKVVRIDRLPRSIHQ